MRRDPKREIWQRVGVVVLVVALYRLGASLPVAGLDKIGAAVSRGSDPAGILNLLSGGALSNLALFALGILPYISASIVMQLLGSIFPSLKQGVGAEPGAARKVTQYTRILAVVIAVVEAVGLVQSLAKSSGVSFLGTDISLVEDLSWWRVTLLAGQFVVGFVMVMYLGELCTRQGLGNGASIIVLTGILSSAPSQWGRALEAAGVGAGSVVIGLTFLSLVLLVWMDGTERRLPILYTRMVGSKEGFLPLKLSTGGVMPAIFASTMLALPLTLAPALPGEGFWGTVRRGIESGLSSTSSLTYVGVTALLIVGFSYLYNAISFNAEDLAIDLTKQGAFIPGVRPGMETAGYVKSIVNRLTFLGAVVLVLVAFIPSIASVVAGVGSLPLSGVSLLIAVAVLRDVVRQVTAEVTLLRQRAVLPAVESVPA